MISNKVSDIKLLQSMPNNFGSFKSIQEVFAYCYFDNLDVDSKFKKNIVKLLSSLSNDDLRSIKFG